MAAPQGSGRAVHAEDGRKRMGSRGRERGKTHLRETSASEREEVGRRRGGEDGVSRRWHTSGWMVGLKRCPTGVRGRSERRRGGRKRRRRRRRIQRKRKGEGERGEGEREGERVRGSPEPNPLCLPCRGSLPNNGRFNSKKGELAAPQIRGALRPVGPALALTPLPLFGPNRPLTPFNRLPLAVTTENSSRPLL